MTAPADYVLDDALHCSTVLTASSDSAATTIAVPETLATVHITAYKYNSRQPSSGGNITSSDQGLYMLSRS
ncbi:MAG: hypothetical protein ACRDVW_11645 [Acidimicrobiales bacterium]